MQIYEKCHSQTTSSWSVDNFVFICNYVYIAFTKDVMSNLS